jgi:hypothetical protein
MVGKTNGPVQKRQAKKVQILLKGLTTLLGTQMQALLEPVVDAPISVSEDNGDTSLPVISMSSSLTENKTKIYSSARLELADNRWASVPKDRALALQ